MQLMTGKSEEGALSGLGWINAETRNPLRSRSVSPKPIEIKIGTTIVIPIIAKRSHNLEK